MPPAELSRRRFLGLLGASTAIGAAGCVDSPSAETTEPTSAAGDATDDPVATTERPDATDRSKYTEVYQSVIDSVVQIRVLSTFGSTGSATGFVYDDAHLVTNHHVVADAEAVFVRYPTTGWRRASVVGTDRHSDLAVLSIDSQPPAADPLPLAETDPAVGTEVVAIGNPYGLSGSISTGIVSGVDRTLAGPGNFSIPDAIQTDAAVNPGNSGGPLVTLDGRVVGVITAEQGDNIGLAISSALTRRVVPSLIETGEYEHPYLGIALRDVTPAVAAANDLAVASGVYVVEVLDGGPSDGVLRGATGEASAYGRSVPVGGDVITRLAGEPTPTRQQLASVLALETQVGEPATLRVVRDGSIETLDVTIGAREDASRS